VTATPIEQQDSSEWTLATVRAAVAPVAAAHGLAVRAFMVGGSRPTAVRIELLRGDVLTCWLELPAAELDAAELDAAPAGVTALAERELTALLRLRYGRGAAS